MALMESHTLRIVHGMFVAMHQQVQLDSQLQHHPILPGELGEEWLAGADVHQIQKFPGIHFFQRRNLALASRGRDVHAVLGVVAQHSDRKKLGLLDAPPLHGVLPVFLAPFPFAEDRLPLAKLFLEPCRRSQIFNSLNQFLFCHPLLQVFVTFLLTVPDEANLLKALFLRGNGKLFEGSCQLVLMLLIDHLLQPGFFIFFRNFHCIHSLLNFRL
mmetsp:Transcript_25634/g.56095  ORF Transcript_25634/g.56095 Transcript_25634/m.56095 type:complete len:214 (+) Transcript_25634:597-1238(+)